MTERAQFAEMFRVLRDPPTRAERERWASTRLVAAIWCCGDELDGLCYQPQIVRKSPNQEVGYPWLHHDDVWQGTFVNEPTPDEFANLTTELQAGAALYGIPLVEKDGYWLHGELVEDGGHRGSDPSVGAVGGTTTPSDPDLSTK